MTSPTQVAARCGFFLLALLACMAVFMPRLAARGGSVDACVRWPQTQLCIGNDLQGRRLVLEPSGNLRAMPNFRVAEGRSIFHKPFRLCLDVGGRVGIFVSDDAPRMCVLSRDQAPAAMEIPVFFVGRPGESLEQLAEDANKLVFDPSTYLNVGSDFSDVTFHLKSGGSRFDEIRPFFLCGLPGLLVCGEVLSPELHHPGCFVGELYSRRRKLPAFRTRHGKCASRNGPDAPPVGAAPCTTGPHASPSAAVLAGAFNAASGVGASANASSSRASGRERGSPCKT